MYVTGSIADKAKHILKSADDSRLYVHSSLGDINDTL